MRRAHAWTVLLLLCCFVAFSTTAAGYRENLDVLLVDDSHRTEYASGDQSIVIEEYTSALDNYDIPYDIHWVGGNTTNDALGPSAEKLKEYNTVIWFTGTDTGAQNNECSSNGNEADCPTIQEQDANNLQAFMDDGGRLFLSGQYIDDDLGGSNQPWEQEFYREYLRSRSADPERGGREMDAIFGRYTNGGILEADENDAEDDFYDDHIDIDRESQLFREHGTVIPITQYGSATEGNEWDQTAEGLVSDDSHGEVDCEFEGGTYWSTRGPCTGLVTTRTPTYKSVYLTTGFEVMEYGRWVFPAEFMRRTIDYLSGPPASDSYIRVDGDYERFIGLDGIDAVEFDALCADNQYNRHGEGIIDASMVLSSSTDNNQDDIEQWDQESPISMTADSARNEDYQGFNEPTTWVTKDPYDVSAHRDDSQWLGVNVSAHIHCKDENRPTNYAEGEGYWGPFERDWFVLDTRAPPSSAIDPPLEPSFPEAHEGNLTDDRAPTIKLTKDPTDRYSENVEDDVHAVRFSCDGASWGNWHTIGDSQTMNVTDFNLDTGAGCTDGDGRKELHFQVRDQAGNIEGTTDDSPAPTSGSTTIWLDTTNPVLTSQVPANDSAIQPRNITVGMTDELTQPEDIDALDQTIRFSGGPNRTFHADTSFDPQWPTSGELFPRIWLSDAAGNTISEKLWYLIDPFRPEVGVSPSSGSFLAADDEIRVTASDNLTSVDSTLYDDTGTNQSFTPGTGFEPDWSSEVTHTLRLWVNDTVGNMFTEAYEYTLDTTPPALVDAVPANDSAVQSSHDLLVSWTDDGSGVQETLVRIDGNLESFEPINYSNTFDEVGEGYHWYEWMAFDNVDNEGNWRYRYLVDDTEPEVHNITPITSYINEDDDLTVTFGDPQEPNASGIDQATIDLGSGSGTSSLSNDTAFDPGWSQDGSHPYEIVLQDVAGNEFTTTDNYVLDTIAPSISSLVGPVDQRFLNASGVIDVTVQDDGGGEIGPSGLGPLRFDSDGTNDSFTEGVPFDPTLPSEGNTTVTFWLEDEAGNLRQTERVLTLDTTPPVVQQAEPANTSFITSDESLTFTVTDALSGVDSLLYDSDGTNDSFSSGSGIDPGWSSETTHTITLWANDSVGNLDADTYEYRVDDTPPRTHTNHTGQPWQDVNASVELACVDADYASSCDTIRYCTGDGCSPSIQTTDPSSIGVGVVAGQEQNITLRYRSTDRAGNTGAVNTTYVSVDKRAPSITFENPSNDSQQGGNITFETTITDAGSGVSLPTYSIINQTDGTTVRSGTLSGGSDEFEWNSSVVANGSFRYEVTANDTLSNSRTQDLYFTVDNRRPSIDVQQPGDSFYNADVPIDIDISRQGEDLVNASYYIYNDTGVQQSDQSTGINQQTSSFTDTFAISSRADGNYSINVSAYDAQDRQTIVEGWFVVDRDAPDVSITGPANESWQSGTIPVQYGVTDQYIADDACSSSSSDDGGGWSLPTARSCSGSSFDFDTGACGDDNDPDCRVRIQATDRAGNTAEDIRHFRIDNSLPEVSIPTPAAGTWFNDDFAVNLTTLDPQGLDSAAYRVNSTAGDSGWTAVQPPVGSRNLTVDVSDWCPVDGELACNVSLRAENNPQDSREVQRRFSLDRQESELSINRYTDGANITPSDSFLVSHGDSLSGIVNAQYAWGGSNSSLPSGSTFVPGFQTQGVHDLTFWLEDEAGNVMQRQNSYNVDLYDPEFHSVQPANTTNISGTDTMTATFGDNFTGVQSSSYDTGDGFVNIFANQTPFEPSWSGTGDRDIRLRLVDHAGRQTTVLYRYYLDTVLPRVMNATPDGGSIIRPQDLRFDVYDAGTGIENASFIHDDLAAYQQFTVNQSFDPGWTSEGQHTVDLRVYDRVDNLRTRSYTYTIDNSTPEVSAVSLNRSFVAEGDALGITASISDTYSSIKNATAVLLNASSGAEIERIQLSDTAQGWTGVYTGDNSSGTVQVNVTAYDARGFRERVVGADFTLDNEAPTLQTYDFDAGTDARFGDHRIFRNDDIRFTADVADVAPLSSTKVQLADRNTNITLSGNPRTTLFDADSKVDTGQVGLINLTRIWMTDSVGNTRAVELTGINGSFRTVRPTINVTPASTDALDNTMFTVEVDANRTYNGTVEVFIPPSQQGAVTDPVFTNTSAVTCAGCNMSHELRSGGVAALDAEDADGLITVDGTFTAPSPAIDTTYTFRSRLAGLKQTDTVDVLAPNVSVSRVWCTGPRCTVNQSEARDINVTVTNNAGGGWTGAAVDTRLTVEIGNVSSADGPALASGDSANITLPVNTTEAGNTTAPVQVSVLGAYNASNSTMFHVIDTEAPTLSQAGIDTSIREFYQDEPVDLAAQVEDNLAARSVTFELVHPTAGGGNTTVNISAAADTPFPADAEWTTVFNETSRTGNYSVESVWAADNYSNVRHEKINTSFSVVDLNMTVGDDTNGTAQFDTPVTINASVEGNRTEVSDALATISKPRGATETVDMNVTGSDPATLTGVYANTTRSGNYTANVSLSAGLEFWNTTSFQVPHGQLSMEPIFVSGQQVEIPQDTTFNVSWIIAPEDGDVENISAGLETGQSLSTSTPEQDLGNITYEGGKKIEDWELTSTSPGGNVSSFMALNASATSPATSFTSNTSVTVVPSDTTDPTVVSAAPVFDQINLGQPLRFYAEVEDNSIIRTATLQVNGTNTSAQNVTMDAVGINNVTTAFTPDSTGNYSYTVFAEDIAGNVVSGGSGTFEAVDEYSVTIDSDADRYRKDSLIQVDISGTGVNGQQVNDFNSTLVMDRNGTSVTLLQDNRTDTAEYVVRPEDPPTAVGVDSTDYVFDANISKDGNTGQATLRVPVYQVLNITILEPNNGEFIPAGTMFDVIVQVQSIHGDPVDALSYVECEACSTSFEYLEQNSSGIYYKAQAFASPEGFPVLPIRVYADDFQGNTQPMINPPNSDPRSAVQVSVNTVSSSPGSSPGTGGGGGGGGGAPSLGISRLSPPGELPPTTELANVSVSTEQEATCEYTEDGAAEEFDTTGGTLHWVLMTVTGGTTYTLDITCSDGDISQTLENFIFSVDEADVESYDLSIGDFEQELVQGETGALPISFFNNGSAPISIEMAANSSCCGTSFVGSAGRISDITVDEATERSVSFEVAVPLGVEPGSYDADLTFEQAGRIRERTVTFQVSQSDIVRQLLELQQAADELNQTIDEYAGAGIDTTSMRNRYNELRRFISLGEQAIAADDVALLQNAVETGQEREAAIRGELRAQAFKRYVLETWWQWLIGAFLLYTLFFMVMMVTVPYYRMRTQLINIKEELDSATEARKNAEKQYFRREIDRSTFMDIMTTRQDEILELRGDKEELEEALETAIRDLMSAERFVKAPIMFVRELNRWIEARRTKGEEE